MRTIPVYLAACPYDRIHILACTKKQVVLQPEALTAEPLTFGQR